MRNINEDIKNGSFKRVYLLYGEEDYLRGQYRDKLKNAITNGDTMNYSYFEGKDADVTKITEQADTLPFFAEYRLVIVENSGLFKGGKDMAERMAKYIDVIPESTVIIFVEKEVDKRGKLFKKVKENGYESEMGIQTQAVLDRWVQGLFRNAGIDITKEAYEYFISVAGSDMMIISKEVEKLICYCYDKKSITVSDVKAITTEQISAKIFDMIDALGYKNKKKALALYYDLIATKEAPLRILFMLARQFNIMLQVKEMDAKKYVPKEMAAKMSMQQFVINKALKQAESFKLSELRKALEESIMIESMIKSGNMDEKMGVEILLIKYSER